jgi:hypothetical protein
MINDSLDIGVGHYDLRNEIVSYLRTKLGVYEDVLRLIGKQGKAAKSKNIKALNMLIAENDINIRKIKDLKKIGPLLKHIQLTINKAFKCNESNARLMSSAMHAIKLKTNIFNKKKQAVNSLRMQQHNIPRFIDVDG